MGGKRISKDNKVNRIVAVALEPFMDDAEDTFRDVYCKDCPYNKEGCFPCESAPEIIDLLAENLAADNSQWN